MTIPVWKAYLPVRHFSQKVGNTLLHHGQNISGGLGVARWVGGKRSF